MGLVGGGHDHVLAGAEAEALSHLPQVDVGLAAGLRGVYQEEVLLHVLLVTVHLEPRTRGRRETQGERHRERGEKTQGEREETQEERQEERDIESETQ